MMFLQNTKSPISSRMRNNFITVYDQFRDEDPDFTDKATSRTSILPLN